MTKVRIRRVLARTKWNLVTFNGPTGSESVGVVDLVAMRKDHRNLTAGAKRGDNLQIILIQVKGGVAARPTREDAIRLRAVANRHRAGGILLSVWKKGKEAKFFELRGRRWEQIEDLETIFR